MSDKKINENITQIKNKNLGKTIKDQLFEYLEEELHNDNKTVLNPKLLFWYLERIPTFNQYLIINNIPSQIMIKVITNSNYVTLNSDTILFNQGDKPDNLYLILKGKISFLLNKEIKKEEENEENDFLPINKTKNEKVFKQIEVNINDEGQFFGEWGLIYNIKRTVSAKAKTDCVLLSISKEIFMHNLSSLIMLGELNRKNFITKYVKPFKKLNTVQFENFYREIKKIYFNSKDIIFTDGEKCNYFYLIYKGNVVIKKNRKKLVILEIGDIIGLESIFDQIINYDAITISPNTILFKFVLDDYFSEFIEELKSNFKHIFKNQKKIFDYQTNNQIRYKNELDNNYRYLSKNNMMFYEKKRIKLGLIYDKEKLIEKGVQDIYNNKVKGIEYDEKNKNFIEKKTFKFSPIPTSRKYQIKFDLNKNNNSEINNSTHKKNESKINYFIPKDEINNKITFIKYRNLKFPRIKENSYINSISSNYTNSIIINDNDNDRYNINNYNNIDYKEKTLQVSKKQINNKEINKNKETKLNQKNLNNKINNNQKTKFNIPPFPKKKPKEKLLTKGQLIELAVNRWQKLKENKDSIFETKNFNNLPLISINKNINHTNSNSIDFNY
jgi:CRP-like cAMP-binding protein